MSDKIDIAKRKESVVFSVRVEKDLLDYYDTLAAKSNRSRNELISLALEYAKDKFNITE
ncbi:MAG: ribbon-helix-helix protein, CopG family [Clostridia bacterium]|nr:ribbon-helix-helix protein, CopG family [Clostridia bacterium]